MAKKTDTAKAPTKTPKVAKTIEKPPKKTAAKTVKATKKTDEPKKATAPKRTKKSEVEVTVDNTETSVAKKILEVCMLLDCTGSMSSWIQRS